MMIRMIKQGDTDQSVVIRIIDSSDGTPETAVEHNTSGIDLWYRREGATKTSITEAALASLDAAHSDGGIEHIGDGYYRLDLADAAFASGVDGVMIGGTVTGMIVIGCYVHLVPWDPQDATRMGLTALPNANADAAGGLPISDAGGLDLDTYLARLTGNVALASVCTSGRLAELDAANLPADIDTLLTRLSAARAGYIDELGPTNVPADIDTLLTRVPNTISLANINTEVDAAIETYHLDHLLAADYDPASKPGVGTALLNELVENDAGVSRFTANALEEAPTGGSAPTAAEIADQVWDEAVAGHVGAGSTGNLLERLDLLAAGGAGELTAARAGYLDELGAANVPADIDTLLTRLSAARAGYMDNINNAALQTTVAQTGDSFARIGANGAGLTAVALAAGGIPVGAFATGALTADAIAANAIGASEFAQDAAREIADEFLNRNLQGGGSGGTRIVRDALRALRNRVYRSGGNIFVTEENDTTTAWQGVVTTAAGDPITEINPT